MWENIFYECGALLRNPIPQLLAQPCIETIIAQRAQTCSEILNISKERLLQWSFVQSMLAACWAVQDHSSLINYFIKIAQRHTYIT
jgi:streptomycin 6-kinase